MQETSFPAELLAAGAATEHDLYRAVADTLGLAFQHRIEPSRLLMREDDRMAALRGERVPVHVVGDDGIAARLVTPIGIEAWRTRLRSYPDIACRVRVVPPSALRAGIVERSRAALLERAKHELFANVPHFSARYVTTGTQGFVFAALLACVPLALSLWPIHALLAVNLVASITFFSCVALRVLALTSARPIKGRKPPAVDPSRLPVYSVLVALYREKQVVSQLLVALGKLQWPRAKLEIKLVCEADDRETLDALRAHQLHPCIEIIEVPPGLPRTKPKALAYALPLCGGEFVTLYDAEDRPHPLQLTEAWARFRAGPANLACLQAPLVATNMSAGTLPMMFAFEYAGLFRGLLPWLARWKLMLPLGGTSNHFRRAALDAVAGWDPYNVTEDADLGIRLARMGYRVDVISLPTFEDGPENFRAWLPQRVRWFKGWTHTWLVHMRNPVALFGQLGLPSFLVAQVMMIGMLASALIHPICVATIVYGAARLVLAGTIQNVEALIVAMGAVNIACGYAAFVAIGAMTLTTVEKLWLPKIILLTPFYWLLLSLAAWLAVVELYVSPHHWHKTPHKAARRLKEHADRLKAAEPSGDLSPAPSTARR